MAESRTSNHMYEYDWIPDVAITALNEDYYTKHLPVQKRSNGKKIRRFNPVSIH